MNKIRTVYLIEDDEDLSEALSTLLSEENFHCTRYKTAEDFLDKLEAKDELLKCQSNSVNPNCFLVDVRLPKMSGLSLFEKLTNRPGRKLSPIIFLTGHGDLEMAVGSLKKGAFDFLTKPYQTEHLIKTLTSAFSESDLRIKQQNFVTQFDAKIKNLTAREQELVGPIASGSSNKDLARKFEISIRTVELHRARIFEKLELPSAIELAKIIERLDAFKNDLRN